MRLNEEAKHNKRVVRHTCAKCNHVKGFLRRSPNSTYIIKCSRCGAKE